MSAATRLLCIAAVVIPVASSLAATPEAATLIASLSREAPASIAFAEVRFSSLLREPLTVSGILAYGGPGDLERQVMHPYRETTTVNGESARIEREGERPRTLALRHAPELKGFLDAFGALLAGDAAALEQRFLVVASGNDSLWQLTLTPTEPRLRRRVEAIVVDGRGDEPRCVATLDSQGGVSLLLLGTDRAPASTLDELLLHCRTE